MPLWLEVIRVVTEPCPLVIALNILAMHVVPFGMNMPSYQSSYSASWGGPSGRPGRPPAKNFSNDCPHVWESWNISELGRRVRPTTASSSACARDCTPGKATVAGIHHINVLLVVSKPEPLHTLKEAITYYIAPPFPARIGGSDRGVLLTML